MFRASHRRAPRHRATRHRAVPVAEPRRHGRLRGLLVLAVSLLFGACVAQTLPGTAGDPQAPPSQPEQPPVAGSGDGVVVEYHVRCQECSAQFTTPDGLASEPEIHGSLRRRVAFASGARVGAVTLTVTPAEHVRVQGARISADGTVLAESGPATVGTPLNLSAVLR